APAVRAGEQQVEEGGTGAPQVDVTGWAGGHAHPDRAVRHQQIVGATLASPSSGRTCEHADANTISECRGCSCSTAGMSFGPETSPRTGSWSGPPARAPPTW